MSTYRAIIDSNGQVAEYTNSDDLYLLVEKKSIDPIDNLIEGRIYWNTNFKKFRKYDSISWSDLDSTTTASDDKLVRVSPNDLVSGYLSEKLIPSSSVIFNEINDGGNETYQPYINEDFDFDFSGNLVFNGSVSFGDAVTVNINANTNNLLIPNLGGSLLVRLNFTGNYSLTGIVPNDITKGQWIILNNVGTGSGIFKDNDAGSIAQNRFIIGANKTVQTDEGIALVYDTVDQRWRSFAINI